MEQSNFQNNKFYNFECEISGRLNGTSDMWGQHHNLTQGKINTKLPHKRQMTINNT